MKLTPDIINALEPDASKRLEIIDDDTEGLWLRITPSGVKTWVVRYRAKGGGTTQRKTLGRASKIGLARARTMAKAVIGDAARGIDVIAVEKAAKVEADRASKDRLDVLAMDYFADAKRGTHRARSRPKKPKELKREQDVYDKCIKPVFGQRAISSITRRDVVDFVARMTKIAGSRGRKCHALISQLFSYAVMKDIVPANIAFGVPVVIPGERERTLTDPELRTIWRALDSPGSVGSNQSIEMALAQQFLAVTAQRSGQVLAMQWSEIDFAERVWKCPAGIMKKSRTHLVPLSGLALAILHDADRMIGDNTFVFASPETGHADACRRLQPGLCPSHREIEDRQRRAA